MHPENLLHPPSNQNERLFKFTILTPHTFLPPNHSESLEDELAEEFAQFLCDRVSTVLGERSYTPHHDGEAFLNMRFSDFEERFLRHSDYTIFITSGSNAACLDLIYPRMLVFLTIRPTWRNRGIVLYVGPPVGQKIFDKDLFANEPLTFPLNKEEWGSPESPWDKLMGTLQTKVPLTPEPKRSRPSKQKPPVKMPGAEANDNRKTMTSMPLNQSKDETKAPIQSEVYGTQLPCCAPEYIRSSKTGFPTSHFVHSSSAFSFRSHFRQQKHNLNDYRSSSLNDMCLFGNFIRCQNKKPRAKKEQQRRYSDSAVTGNEEYKNADYFCFPSRFKMKKKKRLMTEPTPSQQMEHIIVKTPEAVRVSIPEISSSLQPRKTLQTYTLQVKIDDDSLDKRNSPYSTLSSPPCKKKANTFGNGRRLKLRCDSGIASNLSYLSTDISSSSPSLYNPHQSTSLATSPSTVFSSSSPSCLDHFETSQNRLRLQKRSLDASLMHSTNSTNIATIYGSLKFVDDEDPDNEVIYAERRRAKEKEIFVRPGMSPLTAQKACETVAKKDRILRPQIMNPDSKASSVSIEDPTLTEDYEVELPEDFSMRSDVGVIQSFEEQINQRSNEARDMQDVNSTHFDKRVTQKTYPLTLTENTDLQKVQNLEHELLQGMQLDEQIPQECCLKNGAGGMDQKDEEYALESRDIRLVETNLQEEFVADRGNSIHNMQSNPENKVLQKSIEVFPNEALISSPEKNNYKKAPIFCSQNSLENKDKCMIKQTPLLDENLQLPEIINNQLQEQSISMNESMQPSMIVLNDQNPTVKQIDNKDKLLIMDKEDSIPEKKQALKPDEEHSEIHESIDSGLEDSSKTVEASLRAQSGLLMTEQAETSKNGFPSEESIAPPTDKSFTNVTDEPALQEKANPGCQDDPLQNLFDQRLQIESITVARADCIESHSPIIPGENVAALCHQPLPGGDLEGHVLPGQLGLDDDGMEAEREIYVQQTPINCELLAPKEVMLNEKSDSLEISLPGSDGRNLGRALQENVCPNPIRRSISFDRNCLNNASSREACKVLREMLEGPTPETLQLIHCAVKTYDQCPSLADSVTLTIASALTMKSSAAKEKESACLRRMFPCISIAILNLISIQSFAFLLDSEHRVAEILNKFLRHQSESQKEHPDSHLRELTMTIQEAFLNHPLGVPVLLAGTTLLSPWLLRHFPLTLMTICAGIPGTLHRLLTHPSAFIAEHFTDLSEVSHATPTWTIFAAIGSRGFRWRLVRPS
ncbi:unnamed protein product [Hydatigera taeniaeformis]|uniref:UDENN domain-containing protein n=1 Tax=Hydatigena taeniaeformis TaxID=6205 RepID=A0A158RE82_HYDTA|nr:unnamed protein product [Hydatigera taeniaeformis]